MGNSYSHSDDEYSKDIMYGFGCVWLASNDKTKQ